MELLQVRDTNEVWSAWRSVDSQIAVARSKGLERRLRVGCVSLSDGEAAVRRDFQLNGR